MLVLTAILVGVTGGWIYRYDHRGVDFFVIAGVLVDVIIFVLYPILIIKHERTARNMEEL